MNFVISNTSKNVNYLKSRIFLAIHRLHILRYDSRYCYRFGQTVEALCPRPNETNFGNTSATTHRKYDDQDAATNDPQTLKASNLDRSLNTNNSRASEITQRLLDRDADAGTRKAIEMALD